MKKVLFVATVDSHIELFHVPYLKMFKDKGYEVHVATDSDKLIKYCDKKIKLSIKRSPFKLSNLKAISQLKKVIKAEKYDIVHCHTPMGGVVARLAARKACRNGTRVIYTAHGFHFYKGAPLKNWLMFYPVEKWLSRYTDTLITINQEDYDRAKNKFSKRCYDIQYVPGVGVDEKKFEKRLSAKQKSELRKSLRLKDDDKVLIFPAELSKRKNQMWLIKTLQPLFKKDESYHLLLPGKDSLNGKCQKLAKKLDLEKQVHFLGFRDDIVDLLQISDVAVSSAKQEGLPVNLMEAAFLGLPIVATDCRGNRDVCGTTKQIIVKFGESNDFINSIMNFCDSADKAKKNGECKLSIEQYNMDSVGRMMGEIYGFGMENSIPKIIHYCWFGGKPLPDDAKKCIATWKKYCPDYKIIEWNEKNFDLNSNIYVREAFEAQKWAFVTDYVRLYVMYNYGGIYMDTDVELVDSLDNFLQDKAFSGFESQKSIPTGIMACQQNFSLFGEFLGYYKDRHFVKNGVVDTTTNVTIITKTCKKYGLKRNNTRQNIRGFVLYPKDVFCPKDCLTSKVYKTKNTVAIHHFSGSWLESDKKKMRELRKKLCSKHGDRIGMFLFKTVYFPYRVCVHVNQRGLVGVVREVLKKNAKVN